MVVINYSSFKEGIDSYVHDIDHSFEIIVHNYKSLEFPALRFIDQ
jgi:hypothetical protein